MMANDRWQQRPALWVALLLAAGIAVADAVRLSPLLVLAGGAGCGLIAGSLQYWRPRHVAADGVLGLAVMLTGIVAGQLTWFYFPFNHIGLFTSDEPRLAEVELRVDESPRVAVGGRGRHGPLTMSFPGTVKRVRTWRGWEKACGRIAVSVGGVIDGIGEGDRVLLTGMLQRPLGATNPGQFDWARYYRTQRVVAELHVAHVSGVRPAGKGGGAIWSAARKKARELLRAGFLPRDAVDRELLTALMFGDRGPELREVAEAFRATGTAHLLASTGLRIAVLAAAVYLIGTLTCLPPRRTVCMVIATIVLFGFMTLPAPQAVRPVLLCVGVGLATLLRRNVQSVQMLALAALAILVANPLDVYGAGFQLSFVTVLGMMLLIGGVSKWFAELDDPDRRAARTLLQRTVWQRARWSGMVWLRGAAVAAGVAWLVATPLVAFHFEQLNLFAIPAGIVLAPLVFASLVAALLKILLTASLPWFASQWASAAVLPPMSLRHCLSLLARLPASDIPIVAPPLLIIVVYYGLLCSPALLMLGPVAAHWERWRPGWTRGSLVRWTGRCAPAAAGLALLLSPSFPGAARNGLKVTLLSVGAGQCAVIEPPGGRVFLFDCGSATLSDALHECLGPFLRHEGRSRVDAMYLSHGDFDHISAAAETIVEYGAKDVFISPHFRTHARDSLSAQTLLEALDQRPVPAHLLVAGDRFDLGSGVGLEVLWPPLRSKMSSNNTGLVLRLNYGGRAILFPADIQVPPERELLKTSNLLASDVLVAPHHGSCEESTDAFVRAVHPRFIVSSNAVRLTKKQRLFDKLPDVGVLYRTSRCGALTITIGSDGKIAVAGFVRTASQPK